MRGSILFLACLLIVFPCQADIITVNSNGSGDYPTIQAAIDAASNDDVVELQPGTYTGPGNRNIDFKGKAITVRSTDPDDQSIITATVIDCESSGRGFYFHTNEDSTSVLNGLTIINGYAPETSFPGFSQKAGGGIFCSQSSPEIINCVIRNNFADECGGGLFLTYTQARIINCRILMNSTNGIGGGIDSSWQSSKPHIYNCIISDNTSVGYGGGIGIKFSAMPVISNCTIACNTALKGGGIATYNCFYSGLRGPVTNCIVWYNQPDQIEKTSSYSYGWFPIVTYCNFSGILSGNASGCGDNIHEEPLFVDLAQRNYNLLSNSPCIDAGNNPPCDIVETDIEGKPRCSDGDADGIIACDMGVYEYRIQEPFIIVSIDSLNFACPKRGQNTSNQVITIENGGTGIINWNITKDCSWIDINPAIGESSGERDDANINVDITGLALGHYTCELIITANEAFNSPQMISVSLDVFEPMIEVLPETVDFICIEGQRQPNPNVLSISNTGSGELQWAISEGCNWLEANPISGTSTGEVDEVVLEANVSGLAPGSYDCFVTISDPNAGNSPVIVLASLCVSESLIGYSPTSFELLMVEGDIDPANEILSVVNNGGGTMEWQITEDCNWVQVNPTSGDTADETDEVTISFDTSSLTTGPHSCEVVISSNNAANSPQSVIISLYIHRQEPETLHVPLQFSTIQEAIDIALDDDTVIVAEGTCTGIGNCDIDLKGKKITIQSIEPNCPTVVASTIIDCNGTEAEPHRAFYFHSGEDANSILRGLTIKNGYAAYDGGGIHCNSSSPTIANCSFVDCSAENWGGGIYCYKSSPLISNCTFTGNSAFEGGAITTYSYWNYLCSPHIENCHIFGNTASGSGGGINSDCLSTPIISNCLITGNFAGTYGGGGISIFQSNPIITGCTITDNSTASSGGGILQWYEFENGSTITNCIIANNNAMHVGGGVYGSQNCDMTITNSAIFGNNGGLGGGLFCEWMQSLSLRNCTITNNSEINVILDSITGELKNNIIWSNMPHGSLIAMGDIIVSYCDITGCGGSGPGWMHHFGIDGGGNIDMYPLFVNFATGNYHLFDGSICINAGDPGYIPAPDETDIDGQVRMMLGRVDIGADEFYPNVGPVACIIGIGCDRLIETEDLCEAKVTLDGSCSSDAGSSLGTNDDIEYFQWYRVDPCGLNDDEFLGSGEVIDCNLPLGEHTIILEVIDKAGAFDTGEVTIIVQDTTPPEVEVAVPQPNAALQDEVTLIVDASDICGVAEVHFYLREPNDGNGIQIGYEDLAATWNTTTSQWEHAFDTTVLPDGYYVILAKAVDTYDNDGWSEIVPFSIRNWAVVELLPASRHYRAGRTVPVKFALRIDEAVDPDRPFVYNEELEVRIFDAANPGNILQTSLYGDASTDYRIDSISELYITNFKTAKTPAVYEVEIWRTNNDFLIGAFTFNTEILGRGDLTGNGKTDFDDLVIITENWLGNDTIADIAPYPDGDGIVDFRDFAVFAEHWLEGTE